MNEDLEEFRGIKILRSGTGLLCAHQTKKCGAIRQHKSVFGQFHERRTARGRNVSSPDYSVASKA
jgi:hypothetical protein